MNNGNQRIVVLPGNVIPNRGVSPSQTKGHVELHFLQGGLTSNVRLPKPEGNAGRQIVVVITDDSRLHVMSPQVAQSPRSISLHRSLDLDRLVAYVKSDIGTSHLPLGKRSTADILKQVHRAVKSLVE